MNNNDKMAELLIGELRHVRSEIQEVRKEVQELRKELWALKSRFAIIAVTMGLAGSKVTEIFKFLM